MFMILLALVAANPALAEEADSKTELTMADCKKLATAGERAACRVAVADRLRGEAMAEELKSRFEQTEREREEQAAADTATLQALADAQSEVDSSQDEKIAEIAAKVAEPPKAEEAPAVAEVDVVEAPVAEAVMAAPVAFTPGTRYVPQVVAYTGTPARGETGYRVFYGIGNAAFVKPLSYACVAVGDWVSVVGIGTKRLIVDMDGDGQIDGPFDCVSLATATFTVQGAAGRSIEIYFVAPTEAMIEIGGVLYPEYRATMSKTYAPGDCDSRFYVDRLRGALHMIK